MILKILCKKHYKNSTHYMKNYFTYMDFAYFDGYIDLLYKKHPMLGKLGLFIE